MHLRQAKLTKRATARRERGRGPQKPADYWRAKREARMGAELQEAVQRRMTGPRRAEGEKERRQEWTLVAFATVLVLLRGLQERGRDQSGLELAKTWSRELQQ